MLMTLVNGESSRAKLGLTLKCSPMQDPLAPACVTSDVENHFGCKVSASIESVLLEQAPVGAYIIDSDWRLLYVNRKALPYFGAVDQLIGRDFRHVLSTLWSAKQTQAFLERFEAVLQNGEEYSEEFRGVGIDNTEPKYYDWQINRIDLPDGKHGVVCYFTEISKHVQTRRALEDKTNDLREARNEAIATQKETAKTLDIKSRFLSTVSHEVRTPINCIISLTEMLAEQDLGEHNDDIIKTLLESSKHLLQMVNNVLDSARLESGNVIVQKRMFSVPEILEDVRTLISAESDKQHLQISSSCDTRIPQLICADEIHVRQILLNLGCNAIKFTNEGSVTLTAALVQEANDSTAIKFKVIDTGPGMTEEQIAKLFQPFQQVCSDASQVLRGSGLGLSICRDLVGLMQGRIGVDSEPGKGSTFWFEIPFSNMECAA